MSCRCFRLLQMHLLPFIAGIITRVIVSHTAQFTDANELPRDLATLSRTTCPAASSQVLRKCDSVSTSGAQGGILLFPPQDCYASGALCRWYIASDQMNTYIELNITRMDIEFCPSCSCDSLSIFSANGTFLDKYCGSQQRRVHYPLDALILTFASNDDGNGLGFTLSYRYINGNADVRDRMPQQVGNELSIPVSTTNMAVTTTPCPNTSILSKDANSGTILFINSEASGVQFTCSYEVTIADASSGISITFQLFDIGPGTTPDDCYTDHIAVIHKNVTYYRFCGRVVGATIFPFASLTLQFKTFGQRYGNGFSLFYTSVASPSPSVVVEESYAGMILFPAILSLLSSQASYTWQISRNTAVTGYRLQIATTTVPDCGSCLCATLAVQDDTGNQLSSFCGNSSATRRYPLGSLRLKYNRDMASVQFSFQVNYTVQSDASYCKATRISTPAGGMLLFRPSVQRSSLTECMWRIDSSRAKMIRAEVDMNGVEQCDKEYLEIVYAEGTALETICGIRSFSYSLPSEVDTFVGIAFSSAALSRQSGFFLSYALSAASQSCSNAHKRTTNRGTIRYPQDGGSYQQNSFCAWHIALTAPAKKVRLTFDKIEIEQCTDCACDSLAVYSGNGVLLKQFCGYSSPPEVFNAEELLLVFISDDNKNGNGFYLSYVDEKAASIPLNGTKKTDLVASSSHVVVLAIIVPFAVVVLVILFLVVCKWAQIRSALPSLPVIRLLRSGSVRQVQPQPIALYQNVYDATMSSLQFAATPLYDAPPSYADAIKEQLPS